MIFLPKKLWIRVTKSEAIFLQRSLVQVSNSCSCEHANPIQLSFYSFLPSFLLSFFFSVIWILLTLQTMLWTVCCLQRWRFYFNFVYLLSFPFKNVWQKISKIYKINKTSKIVLDHVERRLAFNYLSYRFIIVKLVEKILIKSFATLQNFTFTN